MIQAHDGWVSYLQPMRRRHFPAILVLLASTASAQTWSESLNTAVSVSYLTEGEKNVIFLINQVRTDPPRFAKEYLESRRGEGNEAEECYQELLKAEPLQPLKPSKALSLASRDHATDMGAKGLVGHEGPNGKTPTDRVKKYGIFTGPYTGPWENCSYGFDDPRQIVLQLLIDKGVPSRGHRKNIMEKAVNFIGVAIQPHKTYTFNCVMDFADSIADK